jgi:hypothetical protein
MSALGKASDQRLFGFFALVIDAKPVLLPGRIVRHRLKASFGDFLIDVLCRLLEKDRLSSTVNASVSKPARSVIQQNLDLPSFGQGVIGNPAAQVGIVAVCYYFDAVACEPRLPVLNVRPNGEA